MVLLSEFVQLKRADNALTSVRAGRVCRGLWLQRWLVICLTVLSMLAQIDKYILTLLVGSIKRDLVLTDTEIGLAIGVAFGVANAVVGVPAGWFADRISRRGIIAGAVALWSVLAAACGFANSFWQLFFTRVGVGFGEGILPPACYSLIRDGVDPERRGRAFSAFAVAGSAGAGLSLLLGGALIGAIVASGVQALPLIGPVKPWQIALIVIGIAGVPLALIAYAFADPGRDRAEHDKVTTFSETFHRLYPHRVPMLLLSGFSVANAMLTASIGAWLPAYLERGFGLTPQAIGPTLGILLMLAAPTGLALAGQSIDLASKRGPEGPALVAIVASCILVFTAILVPIVPSLPVLWGLQTLLVFCSVVYLPVTSTIVARLMPSGAIGKTMSLFLLAQGVCGAGVAPVIVALISAHLFPAQTNSLGYALTTVSAIYGAIATACAIGLYFALRRYKQANVS